MLRHLYGTAPRNQSKLHPSVLQGPLTTAGLAIEKFSRLPSTRAVGAGFFRNVKIRTATEKGGDSKEEDEAAELEEKEGPGTLGLRIECRKCRQTVDGPDDCLVLHASDHSPRKRYVCTKCGTQASRLIDLEPHHRRCPFRGGGAGRVLDRADHSLVNTWYREFTQCFAEPDHECFINGLMIMKEDEMARGKSTPVPST